MSEFSSFSSFLSSSISFSDSLFSSVSSLLDLFVPGAAAAAAPPPAAAPDVPKAMTAVELTAEFSCVAVVAGFDSRFELTRFLVVRRF